MGLFGPPNIEKMKARHDVNGLIKALDYQKDIKIQTAAARALGEINDPLAMDALIMALEDKSVFEDSAQALSQMGAPALDKLITVIKTPCLEKDLALRSQILAEKKIAANALVRIGASAVNPLVALLQEEDKVTLRYAVDALGEIGDMGAVEPLIALLKREESGDIRRIIDLILGQLGDQRAVKPLIDELCRDLSTGKFTAQSLNKLGWQPGQNEESAFYWIVNDQIMKCAELGSLAEKALIAALKYITYYARDAVKLLDQLGWIPGQDETAVHYYLAKGNLNKCQEFGAISGKPLISLMQLPSNPQAGDAALVLAKMGDPRAIEPLINTLKDYWRSKEHDRYVLKVFEALSILYKSEALDPAQKELIFTNCGNFKSPHIQYWDTFEDTYVDIPSHSFPL